MPTSQDGPIGDYSGKYYVVYSWGAAWGAASLQIWDTGTGKMIQRIPNAESPKVLRVVKALVIAKQAPMGHTKWEPLGATGQTPPAHPGPGLKKVGICGRRQRGTLRGLSN